MVKNMKMACLAMVLLTGLWTTADAQTSGDAILGKWMNEDKSRVIEFIQTNTTYAAIIRKAPDRGLVGKSQLTGLTYSNGTYNGQVLLPKKGKSFPCSLKMNADSTLELTAKAGFMSKSQVWTRVR